LRLANSMTSIRRLGSPMSSPASPKRNRTSSQTSCRGIGGGTPSLQKQPDRGTHRMVTLPRSQT
jgi:hypothetical protein